MLRTGKLSNGLTYYILHNEKPKDRAYFYLVQKVGSVLEEENQRGLAHFLEHMAFNGTKNFPGNTLVSELEKKGIKFGYNINASTSYDETIYKLNDIPVTRQGIIDTALLVLHDWSGFLTLDEKEIDKERGVVHEEWRTRSSGLLRASEKEILPVIFSGTPYASRIPIGSMDVVDHFKPQQLRDYYKKWYRPDLQAVIVVGDIDATEVEAKLKRLFADVPAPVNPAKRIYFPVPDNKDPVVAIATDPELASVTLDVYWKLDTPKDTTRLPVQVFEDAMMHRAVDNLLLSRYAAMKGIRGNSAPSVNVMTGNFFIASTRLAKNLNILPASPETTIAELTTVLREIARARRFGFTADELKSYIKGQLSLTGSDGSDKQSYAFVLELIDSFLKNAPVTDDEWKDKKIRNFLSELKLDTLNMLVKKVFSEDNMVFVMTGPQKEGVKLPSKADLLNAWSAVRAAKLEPYLYQKEEAYVLPAVQVKPGKIIRSEPKSFGFTQWSLSNGVRVQYKQTGAPNDKLTLFGYGKGGMAAVKLADLPSAKAMGWTYQLTLQEDIRDTARKAKVNLFVGDYDQTIAGTATRGSDVEKLLKMTYLKMTTFKKDTSAFAAFMEQRRRDLKKSTVEPKNIFGDTLVSIMTGNDPRKLVSLQDPATLAKVNYDRMITLFRERFANAADFVFVIAGTMPADSIKPLIEKYLGGLPSLGKPSKIVTPASKEPSGLIKKHLSVAMKTPQTTVTIGYLGDVPMSVENRILMQCLSGTLKMTYNQKMREDEGGTYGVGVSGNINKLPKERFLFQVNFDTDPAKKDQMLRIVYQEIEKMKQTGPLSEYLEKVKENLLKNYQQENSEKNAGWWATQAYMLEVFGIDGRLDYEKIVNSVNPAKVAEFARKLFNQGNLIEVIMDPGNRS